MVIASIFESLEFGEEKPAIRVLLDTPNVKEVRITFRKGQEMKEHKAPFPIVVEVVQGSIDFGVGELRQLLTRGMLVALESLVPHDLRAIEDSVVRLSLNKADSMKRVEQAIAK